MRTLLQFAFESTLILGAFTLLYFLLFRNETNFGLTRKLMLSGIFLSMSIPFLDIQVSSITIPSFNTNIAEFWLPEAGAQKAKNLSVDTQTSLDVMSIIGIAYCIGLVFFAAKFVVQISGLIKILRLPATSLNGYKIIEIDEEDVSFSFFKTIVVGRLSSLSDGERQQILNHEMVHTRQYHSADLIVIDLISILFWFNPLIRIYKNILIQLHEFEADARSVEPSQVDHYCNLMAKVALQSSGIQFASYFHQSLTLKRIKMMRTLKHKVSEWKMIATVLTIASLVITMACEDPDKPDADAQQIPGEALVKFNQFKGIHDGPSFMVENDSKKEITMETLTKEYGDVVSTATFATKSDGITREFYFLEFESLKNPENVFTVVDEMPEFPGGFEKLVEFMHANLKMPASIDEDGKTYVSFVVEKDGSLSEVKVIKGFNKAADQEAMRAVKTFPAWIPGKQQGIAVRTRMVLPIVFDR
jgi:TonB family protein